MLEGLLDILALGELLGGGDPHRDAADVRRARRPDLRARGRAQPRHRGHLHRRRHGGLDHRLSRRLASGPASSSRHSPARPSASCMRLLTVPLGLSQHVTGIGVTLLATSLSYFTYRIALPNVATPPRIAPFQPLDVPGLSDLPFLGPALFQQTPLTYPRRSALFAARRLRALPDAARPRGARRRREPGRRRGAGPRRSSRSASARSSPARP